MKRNKRKTRPKISSRVRRPLDKLVQFSFKSEFFRLQSQTFFLYRKRFLLRFEKFLIRIVERDPRADEFLLNPLHFAEALRLEMHGSAHLRIRRFAFRARTLRFRDAGRRCLALVGHTSNSWCELLDQFHEIRRFHRGDLECHFRIHRLVFQANLHHRWNADILGR